MEFENKNIEERIRSRFGTHKKFASAIGISESSLSRYLKGKNEWDSEAMIKAIRALKIPIKDVESYFFAVDVAKERQSEEV